ncbi:transaldolase family protein [Candidatus Laterigemmans baculatus]|uniref:transaldolase family protein n=1 Tax=Candidatus Laterigemmans baculatus TaxID=2770505 RepID=UPI0013DBC3A5|nr:transaldolase family protein [Candidatus Laterigemmans baculatus]
MTESTSAPASLRSLVQTGTKLFLDSVAPEELEKNLRWGAVGATSNPSIISEIVADGSLDDRIESLLEEGRDDEEIAWELTDQLVSDAEQRFLPIWEKSEGNTGWVSFELDPLLEDPEESISEADRTARYIELGKRWSHGHRNRMIKVPATDAGIAALEELAAAGVTLNVTLMFTADQYQRARDAIWRGAQRRDSLDNFKSVYSIFISRIDVYTDEHVPQLSAEAQGQVGIVNAKQIWAQNQEFWSSRPTRLEQEIIFASTGTKKPEDEPWKYVQALAGSGIQTNPPQTNEAVAKAEMTFDRQVDRLPPKSVLDEIASKVDVPQMHKVLMEEGAAKFVKPQRALLKLIAEKRKALSAAK